MIFTQSNPAKHGNTWTLENGNSFSNIDNNRTIISLILPSLTIHFAF